MQGPTLKLPNDPGEDPAVNLIRSKLFQLYEAEPEAKEEIAEVKEIGAVSKHQKYIAELNSSGKSIAEIQTAWHQYYQGLTDQEKREVWQEFYANQSRQKPDFNLAVNPAKANSPISVDSEGEKPKKFNKHPSVAELKKNIAKRVSANGRLTKKHHLKSLLFGLGSAAFVGLIIVFALFNQLFLAPFITPSKSASATPLIGTSVVGPETKIIIPKLNVEAPVVTDVSDISDKSMQAALERGVTLYPNTGLPGELSNPVIFGHSSNNIFNPGDYKFIFVRLSSLEEGDTIMVNYQSKQYIYSVKAKKIVKPSEVSAIYEKPYDAMITLVTCDPPGSSASRLLVQAEQISPSPTGNTKSTASSSNTEPGIIPSNPQSLFRRILDWF